MSSITVPTLKQLCASQILSSDSHLTLGGENQKFFEYEVLCRLWNDLKSCPQGVLCLQNEMSKIERKYQKGSGQFPADVKISVFFKELTQQFSSKFAEAGVQLGNLTPVYCHEYSQLQEVLRKTWEDEALKLIWDVGIVPKLIGPAPQLTELDDIRNWLKDGANAHQLMNVTELYFPKRKIKALPPEIFKCTQLQWLICHVNQISYLPEGIFEGCTELRCVELSDNQISSLPETLFKGCTKLESVFLNNNEILSVPGTFFKGCAQLKAVILSHNKIPCLPEALFANCTQLEKLELEQNRLIGLPEAIFADCTSLKRVSIHDNPLFCVTDNLWLSIIPKKNLCFANTVFNNYNCLSKLSSFVKLLSFGTESSTKIKDAFEQLERRDQCLIIEQFNSISGITPQDPQGTELRIFNDIYLFCCAVRRGISEKHVRMSSEESEKVNIEVFNLGKLEMMQNERFVKANCDVFDLLPVSESLAIRILGALYADVNILLLIDAMDRVGV